MSGSGYGGLKVFLQPSGSILSPYPILFRQTDEICLFVDVLLPPFFYLPPFEICHQRPHEEKIFEERREFLFAPVALIRRELEQSAKEDVEICEPGSGSGCGGLKVFLQPLGSVRLYPHPDPAGLC